jgi:hypothetical protein
MDEKTSGAGMEGSWADLGPVRPSTDQPIGGDYYPPEVEALFARPRRRQGLDRFSVLSALCGAAGLLSGPFWVSAGAGRYGVLGLDIAALVLGVVGLWLAVRNAGRFDGAVFGMVLGGIGLALWISYVTDPASGGT